MALGGVRPGREVGRRWVEGAALGGGAVLGGEAAREEGNLLIGLALVAIAGARPMF